MLDQCIRLGVVLTQTFKLAREHYFERQDHGPRRISGMPLNEYLEKTKRASVWLSSE